MILGHRVWCLCVALITVTLAEPTASPTPALMLAESSLENMTCTKAEIEAMPNSCAAAREVCDPESYLQYIIQYFCSFGNSPALWFVVFVPWLCYLLLILGDTADQFFCDALEALTDITGISPNLAGVTFLAFGNGAPDVFSSISSFSNGGKSGLGLSALVGSTMFITSVVCGLVALIAPGEVDKPIFFRDCVMQFLVTIGLVFVVLDGKVTFVESMVFVGGYVLYVVFVLVASRLHTKDEEALQGGAVLAIETPTQEEWTEQQKQFEPMEMGRERSATEVPSATAKIPDWRARSFSTPDTQQAQAATQSSLLDFSTIGRAQKKAFRHRQTITSRDSLIGSLTGSLLGGRGSSSEGAQPRATMYTNTKSLMLARLQGAVEEFKEMGALDKFLFIIVFPLTVCRLATIPMVQTETWNKGYAVLSCVFGPLYFTWATGLAYEFLGPFPVWVVFLLVGCFLAMITAAFAPVNCPEGRLTRAPFALAGFVMSITWIFTVANELVDLLSTLGDVMGIPAAILGLTVLAWGNCIGDLAADVAVAKEGALSMAMAGIFAGPMFNTLIGLGLAFALSTLQSYPEPYILKERTDTIISLGFLLLSLATSMIFIWWTGRLSKLHGAILIAVYVAFLVFNIIFQIYFPLLAN